MVGITVIFSSIEQEAAAARAPTSCQRILPEHVWQLQLVEQSGLAGCIGA